MSHALGVAIVFVGFGICSTGVASAQDTLHVRITVVDRYGHPQAQAAIFEQQAAGDVMLASTAHDGGATIDAIRGAQVYVRLGTARSAQATVQSESLRIVVGLPTIAHVVARPTLGSILITAQSAATIVSADITGALSYVPNYRSEAEGGSGALELNGTPLMLPTSLGGASHFSIPSSLVASFSPDQADDGTVSPNLHLHAPTATPQQDFTLGAGSQGLASWQTTFTGRFEKLGYAFVVADQGTQGTLFGRTFRDASGLNYSHSTSGHRLDMSGDLEFPIAGAQVSIVALNSRTNGAHVDLVEPGAVAQGFGPGNLQATSFGDGYVRVAQTRGRDMWAFLDVRFAGATTDDDSDARVALAPIPSYSGYRYSGRYDDLAITRNFGSNSLTAKLSSTFSEAVGFSGPEESASRSSGTTFAAILAHTGKQSSLTANVTAGRQTGPFNAARINATLSGTRFTPHLRFDWSAYSAQAQLMETYYANSLRLSVPGSANFDCAGNAAFASGPSDVSAVAPHVVAAKANVTEQVGERTQISAGGFLARTSDALVVESNSGGAAMPSGYLDALNARYANVCTGGALAASDVYLTHYKTVPHRVGQEAYVSSSTSVGAFVVTGGFETYTVVANGLTAQSAVPRSTLIDGAQLWNVPTHRGSAIVAYRTPSLAAALALAYVSSNNSAHLPAYMTLAAGLRLALRGRGAVTFSAQNLLGRYSDVFQSSRFASSSATTHAPVTFLATPLTPMWTLRYELRIAREPRFAR